MHQVFLGQRLVPRILKLQIKLITLKAIGSQWGQYPLMGAGALRGLAGPKTNRRVMTVKGAVVAYLPNYKIL